MISHITIQTIKFEEEISFYEKYMGMRVIDDFRKNEKNLVFLAEDEDETKLEIIENPDDSNAGNKYFSIGFHIEDIDSMREKLMKDGFEVTPFIEPMPGIRFFFVKDPAGVNIQFM